MSSDSEEPEIHHSKRVRTGSPPDKGKSQVEDWELDCCGICLSESGHGTRGCIDCCDHFFCFVCIIEWSKVESRCPLCKRRFSTIRRPPRPPVFPSERIVNVPVRDQYYDGRGNTTTGPPDLYAEVLCNVCSSTTDDSLLLLCDLCDTAYHTYCVGLGATVPEGDWFCADCSLLRAEQAQNDGKTECFTQSITFNHSKAEPVRPVSIFDIVRESSVDGVESTPTGILDASQTSSRIDSGSQVTSQNSSTGLSSVGQNGVSGHAIKFNARTLGHCRNIHNRIRKFREHWNGFRSGSLRFSSCKMRDTSIAQIKPLQNGCSGELPPVSRSQSHDRNKLDREGFIEAEKAWKMLDMAKAIERNRDRNNSSHQAPKHAIKKNSSCKEAGESSSRSTSRKKQHQPSYNENIESGNLIQSRASMLDSSKLKGTSDVDKGLMPSAQSCSSNEAKTSLPLNVHHESRRLPQKNTSCREAGESSSRSISRKIEQHQPTYIENVESGNLIQSRASKLDSSKLNGASDVHKGSLMASAQSCSSNETESSLPLNVHHESRRLPQKKDLCYGSKHLISSIKPVSTSTILGHDKEICCSSSSAINSSQEKLKVEKNGVKRRHEVECDAKSEIQSLVKLNLKILCGDKKLEHCTFKQVARLATHSILAACGLEHRRPGISSLPECVCVHAKEDDELRRSHLMPNLCRECFFLFVQNVVNTVLLDNT